MQLRLFPTLAALAVGLPFLDILLLVLCGRSIGFWPVLSLVILSALIGASLAKRQGLRVLHTIQIDLAEGRPPSQGLLDAVLILAAGILMIVPGFITDVLGLVLLAPPLRARIKLLIRNRMERYIRERVVVQSGFGSGVFIAGNFRTDGLDPSRYGPRRYEQELLGPDEPDALGPDGRD